MIRLGALPHAISALVLDRDSGELVAGAAWRARVDPDAGGGSDGDDVAASGEASWQVVAEPAAVALRAEDAFVFSGRLLYAVGDALPISGATAAVHHVEFSALAAPGYGDEVIVSRPAGRNAGTLDDATGRWTPTPPVVVYVGPARIARASASTPDDEGDALEAETRYLIAFPWLDPDDPLELADTNDIEPFHVVAVTSSANAALVDRFLKITGREHASPARGRTFTAELTEPSAP